MAAIEHDAKESGDVSFCVMALEEALARFGNPEIFNTDQGSQFTSFAFTAVRRYAEIRRRYRTLLITTPGLGDSISGTNGAAAQAPVGHRARASHAAILGRWDAAMEAEVW